MYLALESTAAKRRSVLIPIEHTRAFWWIAAADFHLPREGFAFSRKAIFVCDYTKSGGKWPVAARRLS
jgi:hypothetical protein